MSCLSILPLLLACTFEFLVTGIGSTFKNHCIPVNLKQHNLINKKINQNFPSLTFICIIVPIIQPHSKPTFP